MKVKDVLKNFDIMDNIKILECYKDCSEEELYSGDAFDCPWIFADMTIDTNDNNEGMFVGVDKNTFEVYLGIYVKEDND
jgi:hypothetical protein